MQLISEQVSKDNIICYPNFRNSHFRLIYSSSKVTNPIMAPSGSKYLLVLLYRLFSETVTNLVSLAMKFFNS